jgi:hypothetical protein
VRADSGALSLDGIAGAGDRGREADAVLGVADVCASLRPKLLTAALKRSAMAYLTDSGEAPRFAPRAEFNVSARTIIIELGGSLGTLWRRRPVDQARVGSTSAGSHG